MCIDLPPLRERGDDIRLLADHYIKYYTEKFHIGPVEVSPGFYRALEQHSWRGNVRELRNVIEGILALLERDAPLTESALPESFFEESQPAVESVPKESRNLARITTEAIEEELRKTNGNVSLAAQRLGISRGTIYSRMKKKEFCILRHQKIKETRGGKHCFPPRVSCIYLQVKGVAVGFVNVGLSQQTVTDQP